jgi:peptide/nickel transport system substrate-binding protein
MKAITWGYGEACNQIWPQNSVWHIAEPVEKPDLNKARQLLTEAGYPDGIDVYLDSRPEYQGIAEVLQYQLKKAGIRTEIRLTDWVSLKPKMKSFNYDMAVSGSGWYADPDARYARFYSEGGPANYYAGGYRNPEVEKLLIEGREETDVTKRKEIYTKIWKITNEEIPHIILYKMPMTHAWQEYVKNFEVSRQGDISYAGGGLPYVWLDK